MVYQCRRSSQHQTTGFQFLSKYHCPQTRWQYFTHTSLLLLFPPYRWIFSKMCSTDRVWQSFLPRHAHSPTPRHTPGHHPQRLCAWTPEVFQQNEGTSASHMLQKQSCVEHQVPPGPRLSLRPSHGTFLYLPFCSFANQPPPPCPPFQLVTLSILRAEEYGQPLPRPTFLLCQPPWCVQTFLSSSHTAAWAVLVTGLMLHLLLISGNSHRVSLWIHHLLQLQQWPSLRESPRPPDSFRRSTSWRDTADCFLLSARRPQCPELWK